MYNQVISKMLLGVDKGWVLMSPGNNFILRNMAVRKRQRMASKKTHTRHIIIQFFKILIY